MRVVDVGTGRYCSGVETGCVASSGGTRCDRPVDPDAPVALCEQHLLLAADWASRRFGVTDVLPAPCLACGARIGVRHPSGWLCGVCDWRVGDVPDAAIPPPRVDVVYYLRWRDRVKIGTTANPERRFAALPFDELLAFELGDRLRERRRHVQFARYRVQGSEWFRMHDALELHVAGLREGVDDPWAPLARWRSDALALRG